MDLVAFSNISYRVSGKKVFLTITAFEWGPSMKSIVFFTDNPFDIAVNLTTMQLFNMRLLTTEQQQITHDS